MSSKCTKCASTIAEGAAGHEDGCPEGLSSVFKMKAQREWQQGFNDASISRYQPTQTISYRLGRAAFQRSGAPTTKRKRRPQS